MFVWIAPTGQTEAGEQVSCGCVVFLSVWVKQDRGEQGGRGAGKSGVLFSTLLDA